jgi:hypothetical protein
LSLRNKRGFNWRPSFRRLDLRSWRSLNWGLGFQRLNLHLSWRLGLGDLKLSLHLKRLRLERGLNRLNLNGLLLGSR